MILETQELPILTKIKQLKSFQIKCYNCFSKDEPTYNYLNGSESCYCSYCEEDITNHINSLIQIQV